MARRASRWVQWTLLVGWTSVCLAQLPPAPPEDLTLFASPTHKDHIGRIVAPVMINGRGPFRFILDTGASNSTVSPELAASLGLQISRLDSITVNGITGTARVPSVVIDRMQAGDLLFKDEEFHLIWAPVMGGADGILGVAGLRTERVLVDFARNRVLISHSPRRGPPRGFVKIPARRLESGLMMVDAQIGWVRARAIIDTGSQRSLGNLALKNALRRWHSPDQPVKPTQVYGSTSEIVEGEQNTVPTITLGRVKLRNVALVFGDFHIFDVWNMQARPAIIIGMDILGSVRALGIDFGNQELYLQDAMFSL